MQNFLKFCLTKVAPCVIIEISQPDRPSRACAIAYLFYCGGKKKTPPNFLGGVYAAFL